ncbi:class I SAM-dependent methyltransferase [Thiohalobacter thiocyanaticus]|uniref:class I SAM-dependent methyltransferase n=1 Tax=Thiohalobacter thiocyanaticus TaxID=585455 RepID=UPI000BBA76DE|nr:class I SAM-dependent methyltransferase [Thiohalobacter thiocyanaticus]
MAFISSLYPRGKGRIIRRLLPTTRDVLVKRGVRGLDLSGGRSVLVAGSGSDPYRRYFYNADRYLRFDIDRASGGIDVQADAHLLPFQDNAFDCVVATEVIEHLDNPLAFIRETKRVLMPGGMFIATVPFMFHQHAHPNDFVRPTNEMLKIWLDGFSHIDISSQGNRLHVISDLITTSFSRRGVLQSPFVMLRLFNHLIFLFDYFYTAHETTAPSGYLLVAKK